MGIDEQKETAVYNYHIVILIIFIYNSLLIFLR